LHYGHSGRPLDSDLKSGDFMVLDMGAECQGYATDITRTIPVTGKFTPEQRLIQNAVYDAQATVIRK